MTDREQAVIEALEAARAFQAVVERTEVILEGTEVMAAFLALEEALERLE